MMRNVSHSFNKKQTWIVIVFIQIVTAIIATIFNWYGKDVSQIYTISTSLSAGIGLNPHPTNEHQ